MTVDTRNDVLFELVRIGPETAYFRFHRSSGADVWPAAHEPTFVKPRDENQTVRGPTDGFLSLRKRSP